MYVKRLIEEKYTEKLHYIDLKNLDNFKKVIKKFLITTFLRKRQSNFSNYKSKFNKKRSVLSSSISNISIPSNQSENGFEMNNNIDKCGKKNFKSLSFNISESDIIYE